MLFQILKNLFILVLLLHFAPAQAEPIIYGQCKRPFPLLMPLDYPGCRFEAWLNGLEEVRTHLPAALKQRLVAMGLDPRLALDAMAALIFRVDVASPETSPGFEVKVFFKTPEAVERNCSEILSDPQKIIYEMAFLLNLKTRLGALKAQWPKNLAQADALKPKLERQAADLDKLWQWRITNSMTISAAIQADIQTISPVCALQGAEECLAARRPQKSLQDAALAHRLVHELLEHWPEYENIFSYLQSKIFFTEARAHLLLTQPSLAKTDLTAALQVYPETLKDEKFLAVIFLLRGELYKNDSDLSAMCGDYQQACALGYCDELAAAKRTGQCQPMP